MNVPLPEPGSGPAWLEALGPLPPRVRVAFLTVPREQFVPERYRSRAYEDAPVLLGPNSTISALHMVALQLTYSQVGPGARILELGSGSGYLLALLSEIVGPGGRVVGVEFDPALAELSRKVLGRLELPTLPRVVVGDGESAALGLGPFDRLLVSYAQPRPVPAGWHGLLASEGIVLAPLSEGAGTFLIRMRRGAPGWREVRRGPACEFVPRQRPLP